MSALHSEDAASLPESAATILRRNRPLRDRMADPEAQKKLALKDAATALSLLWNRQTRHP